MLCEQKRYLSLEQIQMVWASYSAGKKLEWARIPKDSSVVLGIMDNYLT
jgi:hypothetical protein